MNGTNSRGRHGKRPGTSSANRRASEWLVLLESGDATHEDRACFEAWLAEDPGHREAYAALGETWGRLAVMGRRARADGHVRPGPAVAEARLDLPGRARGRRHASAWAAATAAVIAAVVVGMLWLSGESTVPYRTDVGERRTVSLPDGSTVELNTDTELVVAYTDEQRRISMNRGEGFFDIASDADRPFVVKAGQGAIRAVGTEFAVRLKSQELVAVTVTEGAIDITHSRKAHSVNLKSRVLHRGQRAEYDREAIRIAEMTAAEVERDQAWRRGLLVFADASLGEVVAEVNRYTETSLVILDPQTRALRIGGTFKTGNIEALLALLEKEFDIRIDRHHRRRIELYAPLVEPAS